MERFSEFNFYAGGDCERTDGKCKVPPEHRLLRENLMLLGEVDDSLGDSTVNSAKKEILKAERRHLRKAIKDNKREIGFLSRDNSLCKACPLKELAATGEPDSQVVYTASSELDQH